MKGAPVVPPIYMTATYQFKDSDELIDVVQNRSGYIYSRWDNPSVVEVEKRMAALERYEYALGFSSGMAAITTTIFSQLRKDSRIVGMREVYGGTFQLLYNFLPKLGIGTVDVSCSEMDRIDRKSVV